MKLRLFQYKILNNLLYLNKKLFRVAKVQPPLCFFCKSSDETAVLLFSRCLLFGRKLKYSFRIILLLLISRHRVPLLVLQKHTFQPPSSGRFLTNQVYPGGSTMVAKILDFKLFQSLKMHSPGPFALPKYLPKFEFRVAFTRIFLKIDLT